MQGDGRCTQTRCDMSNHRTEPAFTNGSHPPAPVLTHQSGATAIDWSVYRHGHIALFRKSVSISRHLSAQPQVSDQYTPRSLLKGTFVRGMLHLCNVCTCMCSGPAESFHPRDAEILNRPGKAWLG